MPGQILDQSAGVTCPHGASASFVAPDARVRLSGAPVAVIADPTPIAGCPFTLPNGKPQPCVGVRWTSGTTRVRAGGRPLLLSLSSGLCQSAEQIPQGPPIATRYQPRVRAQ